MIRFTFFISFAFTFSLYDVVIPPCQGMTAMATFQKAFIPRRPPYTRIHIPKHTYQSLQNSARAALAIPGKFAGSMPESKFVMQISWKALSDELAMHTYRWPQMCLTLTTNHSKSRKRLERAVENWAWLTCTRRDVMTIVVEF